MAGITWRRPRPRCRTGTWRPLRQNPWRAWRRWAGRAWRPHTSPHGSRPSRWSLGPDSARALETRARTRPS
eukprot:4794567-Prorocentrum_lima.AAC.1